MHTLIWHGLWVIIPQSLQMYPCLPGLMLTFRLHTSHWLPLTRNTGLGKVENNKKKYLQFNVLCNKCMVHINVQFISLLLEFSSFCCLNQNNEMRMLRLFFVLKCQESLRTWPVLVPNSSDVCLSLKLLAPNLTLHKQKFCLKYWRCQTIHWYCLCLTSKTLNHYIYVIKI